MVFTSNILRTLFFVAMVIVGLLPFRIQPALAAPIFLVEQWDSEATIGFSKDFHLQTVAQYDDAALTNTGTELIIVDLFSVNFSDAGIGQHFGFAVLPQPRDCVTETSICAQYIGGVYQGLVSITTGGNPAAAIPGGPRIIVAQNRAQYATGGPNSSFDFDRTSSVFVGQGVVPLPAALPLFGTGLAVMGLIGWRRKRKAATAI